MRSILSTRHGSRVAAVLMAVAGFSIGGSPAEASLTMDLRSTDSANPKLVFPPLGTTNFVLHFDLYAVVTGHDANPNNEGLNDIFFSILSTNTIPPGLKGDLSQALIQPWLGTASSGGGTIDTGFNGTRQDLDGDGDLDIGSNNSSSPDGWAFARATQMQVGHEFLISHVTFTPTAPFVAGETDAAIGLRLATFGVFPAVWQEDGSEVDPSGGGQFLAGAPVVLAIPEPASLSILAAPALALAARRRRSR